jgi:uncharacterized membrane protein required for colicin V production
MLFSIAVGLMVILVTAFWVYQGLFSSALMFFETVTACVVAFAFYESVHSLWSGALTNPGIGHPLALMLLFLATMVLLRLATDRLIPGKVRLPVVVDRAGGGVMGLLTGLVLVGTPLVAVQMLPIGSSVFGFERLVAGPDGSIQQKGFLFKPDSFVAGLMRTLSGGSLGGSNALGRAKPDLLLDLHASRAGVQPEDRVYVPPDCLKATAWWEARQIDRVRQTGNGGELQREFTTEEVSGPNKLLVCEVRLSGSAAPEGRPEVYLRTPQFRVVGPPPGPGTSASPRVYLACGLSDIYTHKQLKHAEVARNQAGRLVRFGPQTDFVLGEAQARRLAGQGGYRFNVAFEVPEDFVPWYVEFKRGARCELTKNLFRQTPPKSASVALGNRQLAAAEEPAGEATPQKKKAKVGKAPGGAGHVANAIEERTGAFAKLPVVLDRNDPQVARVLKDGRLGECHLVVAVPDQPPKRADRVTEFWVPDGRRLLQVGAEKNKALSLYGRALNYAANVAAQISVQTTDETTSYFAQGVYAAAVVDGKWHIEIQYHPEAEQPERCLKPPMKITSSVLQNAPPSERKFGFLFIVDPGMQIGSFSSGGTGTRQPLIILIP